MISQCRKRFYVSCVKSFMQVLPLDFILPPVPYVVFILSCACLVAFILWKTGIEINEKTIIALVPWMAFGSSLRVLSLLGIVPGEVNYFLGNPTVYITTFIIGGIVWSSGNHFGRNSQINQVIFIGGVICFLGVMGIIISNGLNHSLWPIFGLILSILVSIGAWKIIQYKKPEIPIALGSTGFLLVLGQTVDGISTAIGIDILNFNEQTPISKIIIDFAARLPSSDVIGSGWLFVCVKIALAAYMVVLFAEYIREKPLNARIFLIVMIAIGIGPGIHNLILYSVAG